MIKLCSDDKYADLVSERNRAALLLVQMQSEMDMMTPVLRAVSLEMCTQLSEYIETANDLIDEKRDALGLAREQLYVQQAFAFFMDSAIFKSEIPF